MNFYFIEIFNNNDDNSLCKFCFWKIFIYMYSLILWFYFILVNQWINYITVSAAIF